MLDRIQQLQQTDINNFTPPERKKTDCYLWKIVKGFFDYIRCIFSCCNPFSKNKVITKQPPSSIEQKQQNDARTKPVRENPHPSGQSPTSQDPPLMEEVLKTKELFPFSTTEYSKKHSIFKDRQNDLLKRLAEIKEENKELSSKACITVPQEVSSECLKISMKFLEEHSAFTEICSPFYGKQLSAKDAKFLELINAFKNYIHLKPQEECRAVYDKYNQLRKELDNCEANFKEWVCDAEKFTKEARESHFSYNGLLDQSTLFLHSAALFRSRSTALLTFEDVLQNCSLPSFINDAPYTLQTEQEFLNWLELEKPTFE